MCLQLQLAPGNVKLLRASVTKELEHLNVLPWLLEQQLLRHTLLPQRRPTKETSTASRAAGLLEDSFPFSDILAATSVHMPDSHS